MARFFPISTGPGTPASYSQRFGLGVHEGTDIFAPAGAAVVAIDSGRVRHARESRGGLVVYLKTSDGTQFYYSHLSAIANEMGPAQTRLVKSGEVLGYVGDSGNAKGSPPHVHFEWRPKGGAKRDPFPLLERLRKLGEGATAATAIPARPSKQAGAGAMVALLVWFLVGSRK